MAKSYDRNSYGSSSSRRSARTNRPSARSGGTVEPSARRSARAGAPTRESFSRSAYGNAAGTGGANAGNAGASNNPRTRSAYNPDYGQMRKKRKRRRVLAVSLAVVLVLVLGGAGAAFAYIMGVQNNMQSDVSPAVLEALDSNAKPGEPFYMLLMGTDKSKEREAGDDLDGSYRTDSIMLLRADPQEKQVAAVSLMRDTMVDMGEYGKQKLNAAYTIGGAAYTVEVVSKLAGVPISHYAEIDFDGFRDVVDVLGGIDVNVAVEIDDAEAGGYVAAGQQTLNGDQALILCRSRHTYDDFGKGDEYRAANQRMVIGAIARKVLDSDVMTMISTVEALSKYITTDMGVTDILTLANNMRGMDMDTDFYSAVNPTESQYIDDIWWEVMDLSAWHTMMSRIEQGLPPTEEDEVDDITGMVMASAGGGATSDQATADPKVHRTGTVSVRNGTDINGAAAEAQEKVSALGYTVDAANADATDYTETVVVYETADQQERAQEIVDALGAGKAVLNNSEYLFSTDFLVVIGADWG